MLALVGMEGEALTDLRPVGVARFEGKRMDVTAELGLIPRGARVRISEVEGNLIKVRPIG
jgi:membrane-bound serine protease (ClpP class)